MEGVTTENVSGRGAERVHLRDAGAGVARCADRDHVAELCNSSALSVSVCSRDTDNARSRQVNVMGAHDSSVPRQIRKWRTRSDHGEA
ncbi:hypothetical protein GQ600_2069 [Phytophthora cactorum]|nr:hypothetical protein GQ600_2069 [Phytophthora cactorum]